MEVVYILDNDCFGCVDDNNCFSLELKVKVKYTDNQAILTVMSNPLTLSSDGE